MTRSNSSHLKTLGTACMLALFSLACTNDKHHEGFDPREALSTFRIADGFQIEMIASEPLIADPVDMEIDEFGRMYVVEMHGYPLDKSGSGKVILLADTDKDGKMDKRTVFKEGLVLPNSIMRWKKGVLVTDSPALLYLEDTDGDGVANITDTLITGFALTNPQHNANSPVYGLDNWIYVAHEGEVSTREYKEEFGDVGREIVFASDTHAVRLPRNANGRSIRLQPGKKKMEMLSSRCQFGHHFDAWGRLFECDNSNHIIQEVIAERYFNRNPRLVSAEATQSLSDHLNAAEVFPMTTNPDRQLLTDVGVMTSACGITHYMGGIFPEPFAHATFTAEPVSNLVHVDVLRDSQSTFRGSRILPNSEFLASTDAWSRPVNFYVGPDGALYVLDYYRKVIESPEWMSEQAIKAGGLYDGVDKGRIFRITPKNGPAATWMNGLTLGEANTTELVSHLTHSNYWWRINAQRLLVDRADKRTIPLLTRMIADTSVFGRLHALWTLEGLGELDDSLIINVLHDPVPGVRENAIRLAELHLNANPLLQNALLALKNDPDPKVRFQLLLTLGFINNNKAALVRSELLFRDIQDKWVQIAALSADSSQTIPLLQAVLGRYKEDQPAYRSLIERLTTMVGSGADDKTITTLLQNALGTSSLKNASIINGLAAGVQSRDSSIRVGLKTEQKLVSSFFQASLVEMRKGVLRFLQVNGIGEPTLKKNAQERAATLMNDTAQPHQLRADAIDFLALGDPSPYRAALESHIRPKEEPAVQLAALRTMGKIRGTAVSEYVIRQWPVLTPEIRSASIATFLADSNRVALLIDALEKNRIQASSVSFGTSVRLMQNDNDDLRNRARAIFTKNEREREKVNKEYHEVLEKEGDAARGKEVYVKNCAICHQVRGKMGVAIGPDLGTVNNWKKEDVLANILDPNLSIASGFDTWNVKMNDGETLNGIIASETPVAITLRNSGQLDRTINRQEIASLQSANTSAMPVGLEKNISKQEMADLLSFLRRNQDFK